MPGFWRALIVTTKPYERPPEFYIAAENLIRTYVAMVSARVLPGRRTLWGTLMAAFPPRRESGWRTGAFQRALPLGMLERLLPDLPSAPKPEPVRYGQTGSNSPNHPSARRGIRW